MNRIIKFLSMVSLVVLSGCASVVGGTDQAVVIETKNKAGEHVPDVACIATNSRGSWLTISPSTIVVQRSSSALKVECHKAPNPTVYTATNPSLRILLLGNIIVGGPIGLGIDLVTGAAFDYPPNIIVTID
jgi:hypothetical protein